MQAQLESDEARESVLAGDAITENWRLERPLPQEGQQTVSPLRRTSFSNWLRHSSQTYSKIGIKRSHRGGRGGRNYEDKIALRFLSVLYG